MMGSVQGEVGWLRFAPGGSLAAANLAAARLFGHASPDELVAVGAEQELLSGVSPQGFAGETEPRLIRSELRRTDGSARAVYAVVVPHRGAGGDLVEIEVLLLEDLALGPELAARQA